MSGPKLLGITHDPEIIRKNRERLAAIGKNAYYTDHFKSMNTDIENEKYWIMNYAANLISSVDNSMEKVSSHIAQIENIKKNFVKTLESSKLDFSLIDMYDANALSGMVCDRIRLLPEIKQKFMREISDKLNVIQKVIDDIRAEEYRRQQKIEQDKKNEYNKAAQMAEERSRASKTKIYKSIVLYDIENSSPKKIELDEDLSLAELAIIENIAKEVNSMKDMSVITENDKNIIKIIINELEDINNKEKYSITGRKNMLEGLKMYFQMLDKNVAESISNIVEENTYRNELIAECNALCELLDIKMSFNGTDINKLEAIRTDLQNKAALLEEKIYTQDTITEVMEKYGYSSVATINLNESDKTSKIIFENNDMKVCASIGDGAMMLQVVGIGDDEPTQKEKVQQVKQQGAFCDIYPNIKKELEKRKIHVESENCAPVSEESAVNISLSKYSGKKPAVKSRNIHKTNFGKNSNTAKGFYEQYGKKYMYMDE
jgi:hypothetical protein